MQKRVVKAALRRAVAALEKFGWIQGSFGTEQKGFCSWGAINRAARQSSSLRIAVAGAVRKSARTSNITSWNDKPGRRKATVIAAFRRAIEAL